MTHGLFLGCGLLLLRSLFLGCCLLLGISLLRLESRSSLLFVLGTELVRRLDLRKITVGHGLLQRGQEVAIEPLLIGGEIGLHVFLDGDG